MPRLDKASHASRDWGLLILRLVVGTTMALFHGHAKMFGGAETWTRLGGSMENLGITFLPAFWGFMAGFAEFFCSILLALGLLFRPAAGLLALTMLVAAIRHLNIPAGEPGSGWSGASHALELLGVYVALFLTGPGRYSLGLLGAPQGAEKS
jgi:putative oxidoreductase